MRVLILSAILACVSAAPAPCGPCDVSAKVRSDIIPGAIKTTIISPSEIQTEVHGPATLSEIIAPSELIAPVLKNQITPILKTVIAPVLKSEVIAPVAAEPVGAPIAKVATVEAGDVEAAVIDAQVKAQDEAIAAADKARLLADLAMENNSDKTMLVNDQVMENQQEAFWSAEEQKWRYLDAVNTAEAKLDGAIAKDATILARSAFGGLALAPVAQIAPLVASVAPVAPVAPVLAPVAPLAANRASIVTPFVYSAPILKTEGEKLENIVKTAELQQRMSEEAKVKLAALEKNLDAKPAVLNAPVLLPEPLLKLSESWVSQTAKLQSDLKKNIEELQMRLESNIQNNLNNKPTGFVPTQHGAPVVIAPYKLSEPWLTQMYVPGAAWSGGALNTIHPVPTLESNAVKVA